jgi:hypothetical protein
MPRRRSISHVAIWSSNWVCLEYTVSGGIAFTFFLTGLCEQSELASFGAFFAIDNHDPTEG